MRHTHFHLARFAAAATLIARMALGPNAWPATTQTFTPVIIQYPGSTSTAARGINNNGDIAGSYTCVVNATHPCTGIIPNRAHGFLLPAGSLTYLPIDVPAQGLTGTTPRAISEQGVVVGQYSVGSVIHGFACASPCQDSTSYVFPIDVPASLFDDAENQAEALPSALSPPPHCLPGTVPPCLRNTLVVGVSPQGDLVGCYHEDGATMTTMHGWLLRNGVFHELATPGGDTSFGYDPDTMNNGISPTGEIVGFYLTSGVSYIADQNGIVETFTFPGNFFTLAWGVNARGDVVGEHGDNQAYSGSMLGMCMSNCTDTHPVGFLRTRSGDYQSLAVEGATSTVVIGINSWRGIVGQYVDSAGAHGFVYRLAEGNGRQ